MIWHGDHIGLKGRKTKCNNNKLLGLVIRTQNCMMPEIFSSNKPNLGTLQMPRRYHKKVYLKIKSKHGL